MKHRQFTSELRALFLRALERDFHDTGIRFAIPRTGNELGIHLHSPEVWELLAAVQKAQRDGFEVIYIH